MKILFIAGAGRSGSTLLDRLLGQVDGFFSAGELRFIWRRGYAENHLCECGSTFHTCGFWGEVTRRAFAVETAEFDTAALLALQRQVDRFRYVPPLALPQVARWLQPRLAAYGDALRVLYTSISDVSGCEVIIDSSKDPTHALLLSRLPGFEVDVVHLVRDPRAVAHSWTRRRVRPEIHWAPEAMPIECPRTTAGRWVLQNAVAELLRLHSTRYVSVRYEDLVQDVEGTVRGILSAVAQDREPPDLSAESLDLRRSHSVSGNPMRFDHGPVRVRLDDEWRWAMRRRDKLVVTSIALPLLARYRYWS